MKTYIIIPCYNESQRIVEVISQAENYGQVIVVDDGSTDDSGQKARKQGAIVLKHLINRGQGAALETGDRYALGQGADLVVHFDADGQHQADEIPQLIQPIIDGEVEVVFGSRFLRMNNGTPLIKKWLILKPAIYFQNFLLGVKMTDAHNGFRALSRLALKKIRITQDGMAHASEIIEQVQNQGLKYKEVPVTITYHEYGQDFMAGLKILRELLFGRLNK